MTRRCLIVFADDDQRRAGYPAGCLQVVIDQAAEGPRLDGFVRTCQRDPEGEIDQTGVHIRAERNRGQRLSQEVLEPHFLDDRKDIGPVEFFWNLGAASNSDNRLDLLRDLVSYLLSDASAERRADDGNAFAAQLVEQFNQVSRVILRRITFCRAAGSAMSPQVDGDNFAIARKHRDLVEPMLV